MKKIICFVSFITGIFFFFSSCSAGTSSGDTEEVVVDTVGSMLSPGETILEFTESLKNGQYEKITEFIQWNEQMPEDQQLRAQENIVRVMQEAAELVKMENGNLEGVHILSERISADGDTAKVRAKVIFENGASRESDMELVKTDGKWKYKMRE